MAKKKVSPRIAFRLTEREKKQVLGLASRCGLSLSEYLRQRALGFEPKAVQPDAYFVLCEKLDQLTEPPFSQTVNDAAIKLIHNMDAALIVPQKDGDVWQRQASGPSGES